MFDFSYLVGKIYDVPDVVWSGIVASGLTLAGVMLSNRSNSKRLRIQLEHDANQKERDRLAVLHREVYLKLAEEIAVANSYLGKVAQIDPVHENISDGVSGFFAASSKAQLVAQPETANEILDLTSAYAQMVMRIIEFASPIHELNTNIRLSGQYVERNRADVERAFTEIREIFESGEPNEERINALRVSMENSRNAVTKFSDQLDSYWKEHADALQVFHGQLMGEMKSIGEVQANVLQALRSDLGLARVDKSYQEKSHSVMSELGDRLKEFTSRFKNN